ncbi:MAG: hypothetical protein E7641_05590 [Ruminococcaceae bacterium]|nr:hypothetical protein [Oscillospiraceae bacterium]
MATNWTIPQLDAINTRDKELLISAAAGSGKTATLTERIIRSLTDENDPRDISRMLIVTFTKKAAGELRQRIFSAVTSALAADPKNRHLSGQLIKIGSAKICTIDSFYFDLVKENFSSLGLPPNIRIADTAAMTLLKKELMNEVINSHYNKETDLFSGFTEAFCTVRTTNRLCDVFLDIRSHVISYPEGNGFIKKCAEEYKSFSEKDFFTSSYGKILMEEIKNELEYHVLCLTEACDELMSDEKAQKLYLPSFEYDLSFSKGIIEVLKKESYREARAFVTSYSPIPLGRYVGCPEELEGAKAKRKAATDAISSIKKKHFSLSEESLSKCLSDTGDMLEILYSLLSDFEEKLLSEKLSRATFDFDDIRRFAMKLLVLEDGTPTETAKELSEHYTDVYIDEYQDVDRVQDCIFSSLSNGKNRFMVGDIKQSIYVFRGAEPSVFAEYRAKFPDASSEAAKSSGAKSIFMSNNFRCDKNIIDFTNRVCSYLFGICAKNIGYTSDDDLVFSKELPYEGYLSPKVTVAVITPPEDEDSDYISNAENNRYSEAKYVAAEISELLKNGKKANGKPILPEDIAVIYRSKTIKPLIMDALDEAGIEYLSEDNLKYFENPDVLLMLSLLNVIDNPERDIYLAATLHSPLFGFNLEELVLIRRGAEPSSSLYGALCERAVADPKDTVSEKCAAFLTVLERFRKLSLSMPVDKLIKSIYSSKEFASAGISNTENLEALYEYARSFESASFKGLYSFIEYINRLIEENGKIDVPSNASSEGKVKLITAHSSKGLEFPVCFICDTAKKFNLSDLSDSLIFEYSSGLAMKLPDGTGFGIMDTPMRSAVGARILEKQLEEEMRILYVALTRARERLYVTANVKDSEEKLLAAAAERRAYSSKYTVTHTFSFLEWILTALSGRDNSDVCELRFIEADTIPEPAVTKAVGILESKLEEGEGYGNDLAEKLRFEYKYAELSKIPAKLSVSKLSPDVLDEGDTAQRLFEETKTVSTPAIFLPEKKEKISPSERGTATHLFLQFCDFHRLSEKGAREELSRLIEKRFLPKSAETAVFLDELERFTESELFQKILKAKKIIREQRFNLLMSPTHFSKNEEFIKNVGDEQMAVQGVIDLLLIAPDGSISLYDYKTDRLSKKELENEEELRKKMTALHSEQLSYYKVAVERIFGISLSNVEIYSTQAAKTVKIKI